MDCVDPVVAGLELMESQVEVKKEPWQPDKQEEPWYIGKYVEPMW
jgi:hypothetical protein